MRSRTSSASSSPFKNRNIKSSPHTTSTRNAPPTFVDRRLGSPPDHRTRTGPCGGRSRLQLGDQRTGRDGSRCPPSGAATSWPEISRAAHTNANAGSVADNGGASVVKAGSVCSNAVTVSTVVATMARRACSGGWAWASCEQPGEHRDLLEGAGRRIGIGEMKRRTLRRPRDRDRPAR
jgi:hypothetical protein